MAPNPEETNPGPSPAGIVAMVRPVFGSIRLTLESWWFATQMDPNPNVTPFGPSPVGTLCVTPFARDGDGSGSGDGLVCEGGGDGDGADERDGEGAGGGGRGAGGRAECCPAPLPPLVTSARPITATNVTDPARCDRFISTSPLPCHARARAPLP